ncbi:29284_t:CDS:2, partial [Racocetra persica]
IASGSSVSETDIDNNSRLSQHSKNFFKVLIKAKQGEDGGIDNLPISPQEKQDLWDIYNEAKNKPKKKYTFKCHDLKVIDDNKNKGLPDPVKGIIVIGVNRVEFQPNPIKKPPYSNSSQVGSPRYPLSFIAFGLKWFFDQKKGVEETKQKIAEKLKKLYQSLSRKQHKRNEDDLTKNSKHFEKARLKLMKAFRKVVRRINDRNHKLSRKIVDKFDLIAHENLKLSKTFEKKDNKRKFSKYTVKGLSELRISDFFAKLNYKAKLKKKITYPVDPTDTSKRCFRCGKINQDLERKRWFICANSLCSYEADRDVNAAHNILYKARMELGTLSSERV